MAPGDRARPYKGTFIRIFDAILEVDHPDHKKFGVPNDHKPFEVKPFEVKLFLWRSPASVIESHLCSRSVSSFGLEGGVTM